MNTQLEQFEKKLGGFGEFTAEIGALVPDWDEKINSQGVPSRQIGLIEHDQRLFFTSARFCKSLNERFGLSEKIYKLYRPDEVFERIQEVYPKTRIRVAYEGDTLLAATNPAKAIIRPRSLTEVLGNLDQAPCQALVYRDGVIHTTHRRDEAGGKVFGDQFAETFTLKTPIDGFGLPSIYLSLIRWACTNGLVGYAPAFRSEIQTGAKDDPPEVPLGRALRSFNNEEGYQALRQRMESARNTLASLHEVHGLQKTIERSSRNDITDSDILRIHKRMSRVAGDVTHIYNVASPEAIKAKRLRVLPMRCSVYDLFNIATEITTHHRSLLDSADPINAWVGSILANDYDLEGGEFDVPEPRSFYMNN